MLREGDDAPDFALESDAGKTVTMRDLLGKRVVLYFYPRDNTPGCTREAIAFSEAHARFRAAGAVVVGVSRDSVKSHCGFRDKHGLRVTLLSDPNLSLHRAYGSWGEKMMYGKKVEGTIRSTFVLDERGKITHVFPSVKVDGHAEAVLAALAGEPTRASAPEKTATPAKKTATAAKKGAAKVTKGKARAR